jgi:hypothetical protein
MGLSLLHGEMRVIFSNARVECGKGLSPFFSNLLNDDLKATVLAKGFSYDAAAISHSGNCDTSSRLGRPDALAHDADLAAVGLAKREANTNAASSCRLSDLSMR